MQEGTKTLDKYIILTYFLLALFVTPLVAGLDRRLNLADTLPFFYLYAGIILYLLSAVFSVWPMLHNPFFETTVRIQENKSHRVITTGPYRIVRHPGYLGMILSSLSMPFALGSKWAIIPMVLMVVLVVLGPVTKTPSSGANYRAIQITAGRSGTGWCCMCGRVHLLVCRPRLLRTILKLGKG